MKYKEMNVGRAATFWFGAGEDEVLRTVAEGMGKGTTPAEALRKLLRAHAQIQMQTGNVAVGAFIDPATDRIVLDLYADYRRAVRGEAGWRLAEIPPGGAWEGRGLAGKVFPCPPTRRFTPGGVEDHVGPGPLPADWLTAETK
jgi:hypothetical protein